MARRDPRVDDYLRPLPEWQRRVFEEVRDILHEADPELTETIKRTVQPYFVLDGNVAAFLAARDHVNVFLYDPLVSDPRGIITHGHENTSARQIWINEGDPIDHEGLLAIFREIIAHNRAGGWRRLKAAGAG